MLGRRDLFTVKQFVTYFEVMHCKNKAHFLSLILPHKIQYIAYNYVQYITEITVIIIMVNYHGGCLVKCSILLPAHATEDEWHNIT